MNFTTKINIKRLSPKIIIAGMLIPMSCVKSTPEQHDVEIQFHCTTINKDLDLTILQNYANDARVQTIYLIPVGEWDKVDASGITSIRKNSLEPCIKISPKIMGDAVFRFKPGEASKVPTDSLWFEQNGWAINHKKTR